MSSRVSFHLLKLLSASLVVVGSCSVASYASPHSSESIQVSASFKQAAPASITKVLVSPRVLLVQPQSIRTKIIYQQPPVAAKVAVPTTVRRFMKNSRATAAYAAVPQSSKISPFDPAERVIRKGLEQLGKRYRRGGETPASGFDCSGLVQYSMKKGAGVALPRTAAAQYQMATKVRASQAMRGDLVFFNTSGRRVSHVGIYLGNGAFLHAPRTGKRIARATINGYWARKLIGFGRIPGACKVPNYYT